MKQLLYKEFRLAAHPTIFFFPLFALMLLIPSYPYYVAYIYTCLSIFLIFLSGRENHDIEFTAILPVRKRDIVRARVWMIVAIELFQIVFSIPFALLGAAIDPTPNLVGIEANVAFFGLVLVMYGLFNLLFLTIFYRTGYSAGRAFLFGGVAVMLYIVLAEGLVAVVPSIHAALDTLAPAAQIAQIPVLLGGAAVYAALTWLACRISAARFERVDL